jgi:hypothetical protein
MNLISASYAAVTIFSATSLRLPARTTSCTAHTQQASGVIPS